MENKCCKSEVKSPSTHVKYATIPDEATAILLSYDLGGQSVVSRIDDVQLLTMALVGYSRNRTGPPSLHSQSGQTSVECHTTDGNNYSPQRSYRVTLRGMGGIGKTTVAAMVVHEPEIRSSFNHICWINLGKRFSKKSYSPKLQLQMYFDCLQRICQQINLDASEFCNERSDLYFNPADNSMKKAAKEVQAMERAKIKMSQKMQEFKVLIVIDDVWDNDDCDWFDFNVSPYKERDHILFVTTRTDDDFRFSRSVTINMNLLSEEQSISLFFTNAGMYPLPTLSTSDYALASNIVRRCGYLPIAIKTAGRLLRYGLPDGGTMELKDVAKHVLMTTTSEREEYSENYSNSKGDDQHSIQLFLILDRTFAMIMSRSLRNVASLFFAAFAIVFSQDTILRPWVQYESVDILWRQLKKSDYFIYLDIEKPRISTNELLEGMRKIGVICVDMSANLGQIKARKYSVSHDLMWHYGRQCASLLNEKIKDIKEGKKMSLLPSWSSISFDHSWVEKLQDTTKIDWNKLLVDQYKAIVQEQITDENCKIMSTALYTLPLHMMNALEFNEVFDILTNKIFVTKRLLILGFEMGTKGQISNIEMLFGFESSNSIHTDEQRNDTKEVSTKFTATFCLNFFADIIWNFKDENQSSKSFCHGSSKSLVEVGRTLQKHSSWNEAMDCFYKGLKKMYKAGYDEKHADVIQILQLIKSSSPQRIVLVPFSSPHGLILTKSHILQQQNGQKVSLELISHPNCAIIPMSSKFISDKSLNFNPYIEIRCGPKENAMIVTYDGTFITRVDDGAVLSISFGWIKEGGSVALMKGPKTPKEKEEQKKISNGSRTFIVNMNGTISPASVPNLVLGIETYPILRLVKRNSPNIIIFRNAKLLNDCQSILKRSNDNVSSIGLDIISHPDLSLVAMLKDWIQVGPTSGSAIGLGPNNEMLQAQYLEDGQIYLPNEGGYLKVYDGNFCEGQAVCAVKTAAGFLLQKVTFIINHDGSISPSEAPHLGFGFYESVSSLETTVME